MTAADGSARLALLFLAAVGNFSMLPAEESLPRVERRENFEQIHRQALERKRTEFGAQHPVTATAMRDLGLLLLAQERAAEAEPYLKGALQIHSEPSSGQPDRLEMARDSLGLAQARFRLGDPGEAAQHCSATLEHLDAAAAGEPDLRFNALRLCAQLALEIDRPGEAADRLRSAVAIRADPAGFLELAGALQRAGELAAAGTALERAEKPSRAIGAAALGRVAEALHDLALAHVEAGDRVEARELLERARSMFEQSIGLETAPGAAALDSLGNILRDAGDMEAARQALEAALGTRRRLLGTRHSDTAQTLNNLAGVHHLAGNLDLAEPLYRESIAIFAERHGARDRRVAQVRFSLGYLRLALGDRNEAAQIFRQVLGSFDAGDPDPLVRDARAALASIAAR